MSVRVVHDHQVIGTHPARARAVPRAAAAPAPGAADDLVVTDLDGTQTVYAAGTWSAGGEGVVCAFTTPGLPCPMCSPQAQSAPPVAKA